MPLTGAGDEGPIPRSDTRAIRNQIPKTRDFSQWVAFGEKVIVGVLATLITKCLMWLTTGIGESPLGILISIVGGVGGLILFIYFQRYVGILGAGAQPEGSPERQDYDELRQSLVEGGEPARMYARLLTGFLDIVAPGLANRSGIMGAIAMARSAIEKGATVFEKW